MLNVRAKKNIEIPDGGISLFLFEQIKETSDIRVVQLTLGEIQSNNIPLTSQKVMTDEEATRLMDDLWGAGIRPTEGVPKPSSAGVIEAKDAHLGDMREIIRCLLPKAQ